MNAQQQQQQQHPMEESPNRQKGCHQMVNSRLQKLVPKCNGTYGGVSSSEVSVSCAVSSTVVNAAQHLSHHMNNTQGCTMDIMEGVPPVEDVMRWKEFRRKQKMESQQQLQRSQLLVQQQQYQQKQLALDGIQDFIDRQEQQQEVLLDATNKEDQHDGGESLVKQQQQQRSRRSLDEKFDNVVEAKGKRG